MKPWQILTAGASLGVLGMWFLTPRPTPDTGALEAAQAAVAQAHAKSRRDSVALAQVTDSLRIAHEHTEKVTTTAHLVASQASAQARRAQASLRAVLDSLGASTAALDTLEAATGRQLAAKDAEIDALRAELAILWRRVEASDTLIGSLMEEIDRHRAVDAERDAIQRALEGQVRGGKIRERLAEAAAAAAIVWKITG